jgi:ribonuclease P protein component
MYADGSASTASARGCRRGQAARSSSAAGPRVGSTFRREPVQRRNRLTRSRDFDHVYRRGRSVSTRFLTLYWFDREEPTGDPRLGLAVPREVGNAVVRNKIKRQLRDLFRERIERVAATHDYVLRVRAGLPEAAEANGHAWLVERVDEVFGKAGA